MAAVLGSRPGAHILLTVPHCNPPGCLKIDINPVLLHAGSFSLYWYGLMIAVGFVVAIRLAMWEAERRGLDADQILSTILVAALLGLLGARLYFVLESQPGYYLSHPGEALSLWQGGLSFFGGIFGAIVGAWLYCSRYRLPTLDYLDAAAVAVPLGQAIGRLGNLINGDVAGYPTKGFGVEYVNRNNFIVAQSRFGVPMHPVALYDSLFNLALFAFLFLYTRRQRPAPGRIVGLYLGLFSAGQVLLYSFRDVPIVFAGLKQGQLTALPVVAAGLWLALTSRPGAAPAETPAESRAEASAESDPELS